MKPITKLIVFYVIGVLLVLLLSLLFSSCEVLKRKRSVTTDSVAVRKVDSTVTHKFEVTDKRDSTWWREIVNFNRDTTINNFTTPINNYYPAQIIREGGTFSRDEMLRIVDSANKNKSDSTHVATVTTDKSKEIKVLSFWQMVGIVAGVILAFEVLKFAKNKVHIGLK